MNQRRYYKKRGIGGIFSSIAMLPWDDDPDMYRVNSQGKRTLRVWYIHHAESEALFKLYDEDEVMECIEGGGCDSIGFHTYQKLRRQYVQGIAQQTKNRKKVPKKLQVPVRRKAKKKIKS